jgi:hypothetical protein
MRTIEPLRTAASLTKAAPETALHPFTDRPARTANARTHHGLKEEQMGLGVSIFLIAVGAILTWAVNATVSGLELDTIGVILMVVGILGLVLSMIFWSSWGGFGGERAARRRTTYVDEV